MQSLIITRKVVLMIHRMAHTYKIILKMRFVDKFQTNFKKIVTFISPTVTVYKRSITKERLWPEDEYRYVKTKMPKEHSKLN